MGSLCRNCGLMGAACARSVVLRLGEKGKNGLIISNWVESNPARKIANEIAL